MTTILAFLGGLGLLVFIHEGGHFFAARWCGVKVKRFSIGFGKPLFKGTDKHGTEWAVGWIPLGGYVAMTDQREGALSPEDEKYAFNTKPVWKRAAILVAGPAANILAAWFFMATLLATPHQTSVAELGPVRQGTVASIAGFEDGDTVRSIVKAGVRTEINDLDDWNVSLMEWGVRGDQEILVSVVTRGGEEKNRLLVAPGRSLVPQDGWLKGLGWIHVGRMDTPPKIESLVTNGPLAKAGLHVGDVVMKLDIKETPSWSDFLMTVSAMPGREVPIEYMANGDTLVKTKIKLDSFTVNGVTVGRSGTMAPPSTIESHMKRLGFFESSMRAWKETWTLTQLTVDGIWKLASGKGSSDQVSGPIGIAEHAGKSAGKGISSYLSFLAVLSLSLGIFNLLPIPVLDGGQLVLLAVEKLKGSPMHRSTEAVLMTCGFVVIGGLTLWGILNDTRRMMGW